jgi:hypothetical protein
LGGGGEGGGGIEKAFFFNGKLFFVLSFRVSRMTFDDSIFHAFRHKGLDQINPKLFEGQAQFINTICDNLL